LRSAHAPGRRWWHPAPSRPFLRATAPSDAARRSWSGSERGPGSATPPWLPVPSPQGVPSRPSVSPVPTMWSQHDQVISVDDLVEALVAEGLLDLPGLRPANLSELVGVVVDQPACELRSVELGQGHHRPRRKFPFHLRQARGEQALAPLS